jgi:holliday junction DNA helicase RuvA
MIGRLRGKLLSKHPPELLLDVMGVGYEVEAPMSTFYQLPDVGEDVVLHTHLVVREDAQLLYGFYSLAERRMFRSLIRINSVGPKLALTILSGVSADEFSRAIFDNDVAALTRLPGVGKKTAERLVVELRDKLETGFMPSTGTQSGARQAGTEEISNPVSDAVSALIALGYKAPEASRMVRAIDAGGLVAEEIIRSALQAAARHV